MRETIMLGGARGSVERVVHAVKEHVPNRFGDNDCEDLTGWAWLGGKRVPLQTGYRGGVLVWEIDDDYPEDVNVYA